MKVTPDTSIIQSLANAALRGSGDNPVKQAPGLEENIARRRALVRSDSSSSRTNKQSSTSRSRSLSSQSELDAAKAKTAKLSANFNRESPLGRISNNANNSGSDQLGQIVDIRV